MKKVFTTTLFVLICGLISAQNYNKNEVEKSLQLLYKTGNPSDWPKRLDAVVAAPGMHKVLLENDSVRVLEVISLPGEIEPLHHHQYPGVLYVMDGGDFIDRDGDGNVLFDSRKLPSPLPLPMTTWLSPQGLHSVENLSKTKTIHLIRVEIKK
jgi:predicted metal-dependent enzyme (double-stranded beta helix superfamily)